MRFLFITTIFVMAWSLEASAQVERWRAADGTAVAVTGDIIDLTGDRITFDGGQSLSLRPVANAPPGVFTVTPNNLALKQGTTLCGRPITYLVVWQDGEKELFMRVYEGDAYEGFDGLCAQYSYFRE